MNTQTLINIRNNISNHKPDSTLKMLKSYLVKNDNNDMFNFVIMQEAQYKSLKNQQMAGTIDSNQFDIGLNKINANILNLIDELDVIKIEKIEIKAKSTSKPFNKFEKIFLTSFCIFVIIMISGFTKYSFFKLFNYNISTEQTKSDLLGKSVCFKNDSCWIFLSKDNFKEFNLVNEKIDGNNYEKTVNLKLEDARSRKLYHMKLFIRYTYDFYGWKLDDNAVFECYGIDE